MTEQTEIELLLKEEKLLMYQIENPEERLFMYKHDLAGVKVGVNTFDPNQST